MKRWQQCVHPSFTETYILFTFTITFNGQFYDRLKFELKRYGSHRVSIVVLSHRHYIYLFTQQIQVESSSRTNERTSVLFAFRLFTERREKKDRRQVPLI